MNITIRCTRGDLNRAYRISFDVGNWYLANAFNTTNNFTVIINIKMFLEIIGHYILQKFGGRYGN